MSSPSQKNADLWNRQLRYFRFRFAQGGTPNSSDDLFASFRFVPDEKGLLKVFDRIGVELQRIPASMPRREVGRSYDAADRNKFADPISVYPKFASPGFVRIAGMPTHLSVFADRVRIVVSGANGNHRLIDDSDYQNALKLEALLPQRGIQFIRIASRKQIEELIRILRLRNLPALRSVVASRPDLIAKGATSRASTAPVITRYGGIRDQLGAEFADDDIWQDAHEEIHMLVSAAANFHANPHDVAHCCPGFSSAIIECICADAQMESR